MKDADSTRDLWATLLSGGDPLGATPFVGWLQLATSLMAADSPAEAPDPASPEPAGPVFDWTRLMQPSIDAWTGWADTLQGAALSWFKPASEHPMARLLGHPAAVVGGENSNARLSMQAALAYTDFVQSAMSHQRLQMQGWMEALRRFAAEFFPSVDESAPAVVIKSFDDLVNHWGTIGETALQQHSRTDGFLASQADLLRKDMRYRVARRRVIEAASHACDIPTLTDLDEMSASIHALRKEVRAVRQMAESAAATVPAANAASFQGKPKARSASATRHSQGKA
jgi:hypothetical protein